MFSIIGADGKEYGPVPADKVRDWLASGRANGQTRIKRADSPLWTTIAAMPEFAGTLGTAVPSASPHPAAAAAPASASAAELIARAAPLRISGCIKRGWDSGRANFWPLLGGSLLIGLCAAVAGSIPLLGLLSTFLLSGVFNGGLYYYCLKRVRGEPTELGDAFSGFSVCFVQLMLASLVCVLLTIIGFFCLILPGIYLAVAWFFAYLVVREKLLPFWDGMELCRKVVTAQWWRVFGLLIALTVMSWVLAAVPVALMIAGAVAMRHDSGPAGAALLATGGLGLLVAICLWVPLFTASVLHAYDDLFNPPAA